MITVLVGGSFGSEGKGLIAGHIAKDYSVHVRVGAANAGHTVYDDYGDKHVVQQLPCAAYANPSAKLVLGAGAMISPGILQCEILDNVAWRWGHKLEGLQLYIDRRAHCVQDWHIVREQSSNLAERIGSTSTIAREGIGAAQASRVMRTQFALAYDYIIRDVNIRWIDSVEMLHRAIPFATNILLEGTQGTGLDNVVGYEYPYVTSRHVIAAGIAADCGLGPRDINEVIVVARTYPIRVAGNSGPFWYDSKEISWQDVGIDPEKERTTVTKKIRRVATFSHKQIRYACQVNGATRVALTFADYICPEIANKSGLCNYIDQYDRVGPMIRRIEQETGIPVTMVGTGPNSVIDRESCLIRNVP